jgi:catecholate siderophore receptor
VGEQLASLTVDTQGLAPEKLRSLELGAKWTLAPGLTGTAAVYHLKRSNVLVADATDPTADELVDGQKGRGLELELGGRLARDWTIRAAYAWQQSTLLSTQSPTALAGARMSNVPRQSLSLWSRYQWRPAFGLGLGLVSRSAMDTSTSNLVQMPGYARFDAGLYFTLAGGVRLQANIENLLDRVYYKSAYNDNNITPGSPRALRLTLDTSF